jgi:hypothetical protein
VLVALPKEPNGVARVATVEDAIERFSRCRLAYDGSSLDNTGIFSASPDSVAFSEAAGVTKQKEITESTNIISFVFICSIFLSYVCVFAYISFVSLQI